MPAWERTFAALPGLLSLRSCDYAGTVRDRISDALFVRDLHLYTWLRDLIRDHGCPFPVLVRGGMLHDGHHRVAIAAELGMAELPVTDSWSECGALLPRGFLETSSWEP
jgi:hypothetical protein